MWHSKHTPCVSEADLHTIQYSFNQRRNFTKKRFNAFSIVVLSSSHHVSIAVILNECVCVLCSVCCASMHEYASWNWAYEMWKAAVVSSINGNDNPSRFYFYSPTKSELKHFHKIFIPTIVSVWGRRRSWNVFQFLSFIVSDGFSLQIYAIDFTHRTEIELRMLLRNYQPKIYVDIDRSRAQTPIVQTNLSNRFCFI